MRQALLAISLLLSPLTTYANISFTEIMYDLEGSDSGREWVEVYNSGAESVDMTDWRFNDGSNHLLDGEDMVIGPGGFAVLVDDEAPYQAEGKIIDTVMSLNNTADTLSLFDADGVLVDEVAYTNEQGAAGDGNSLQFHNGVWIAALPTPGRILETSEEQKGAEEPDAVPAENEQVTAPHVEPTVTADAGGDRPAIASSLTFFDGHAYGLEGRNIGNARYLWSFGDGSTKEGAHVAHSYIYPGTYSVTLTVSSGEYSASDYIEVTVKQADVEITNADRKRILITNRSTSALDLSFWHIAYNGAFFAIPKGTFIKAGHSAVFPSSITGLVVDVLKDVSLLYPNGMVATTFLSSPEQVPFSAQGDHVEPEIRYVYVTAEDEEKIDPDPDTRIATSSVTSIPPVVAGKEHEGGYVWLIGVIAAISVAGLILLSGGVSIHDNKAGKRELSAEDFKIHE